MKKLLICTAIAAMLLAFTACDGNNSDSSSGQPDTNSIAVSSEITQSESSGNESSTESASISLPEQIIDIVDDTPSYEDMYDSQKVEIINNEVIQTSVAGDITQKLRFIYNDEKTELKTVRFEFYLAYEDSFEQEAELYKELGYTILEMDKKHIIMEPSKEKIDDWKESYPTMEQLADALKE